MPDATQTERNHQMALKIRLRRMGRKKAPHYRIVVAESSMPRDGRFVATIGHYNPTTNPAVLKVDRDKALAWMDKGAMPTDTVRALLRKAGVNSELPAEGVVETVKQAAGKAADVAKSAAKGAAGAVAAAAAAVSERVQDAAASVAETVSDAVSGATETVSDAAETVSDAVSSATETVTETAQDAAASVAETVTGSDEGSAEETPAADEDKA